jgi:hypothetical protein
MCYNCVRTKRGKQWLKWGRLRFSINSADTYLYVVMGKFYISWLIPKDRWIKPEVFNTKLRTGAFLGPLTLEWWK